MPTICENRRIADMGIHSMKSTHAGFLTEPVSVEFAIAMAEEDLRSPIPSQRNQDHPRTMPARHIASAATPSTNRMSTCITGNVYAESVDESKSAAQPRLWSCGKC